MLANPPYPLNNQNKGFIFYSPFNSLQNPIPSSLLQLPYKLFRFGESPKHYNHYSPHLSSRLKAAVNFITKFPQILSPITLFTMNVVEVKVGLHCDQCIKKILKAIKKIEDIETYNVDTQLNKLIVTGNVTTEQVIRVLQKGGKNATAWEEAQTNC